MLVLGAVAIAGQRDFAQVPRLVRALAAGDDPRPALSAIAWMDRVVLLLAAVIVYLGPGRLPGLIGGGAARARRPFRGR